MAYLPHSSLLLTESQLPSAKKSSSQTAPMLQVRTPADDKRTRHARFEPLNERGEFENTAVADRVETSPAFEYSQGWIRGTTRSNQNMPPAPLCDEHAGLRNVVEKNTTSTEASVSKRVVAPMAAKVS